MPRTSPPSHTRGVRVPDDLWSAFDRLTADRNETPSEVIRELITGWVDSHQLHAEDSARVPFTPQVL